MILIENLMKNYGTKTALEGISFHIGNGEVVGFLGPNGAGKSTTLNILTGCLSATSGTVKVAGIDVFEHPDEAKKRMGFLPEQPPLYKEMKVNEYLNFVYDLKRCNLPRKKHLKEVADITKITEVGNRVIGHLSKGFRQRVGIAGALVGNPPVIILDEPTVGLDPKQIIEIRNLIRKLGREHTVILSTHILSEVQSVCDRVVIINEGRIIADEKTSDIMSVVDDSREYDVRICGPQREVQSALGKVNGVKSVDATGERDGDAYLYRITSESGVDVRKPVFYMLSEKGWPIVGMEAVGMSLEEVFIRLMDSDNKKRTLKNGKAVR